MTQANSNVERGRKLWSLNLMLLDTITATGEVRQMLVDARHCRERSELGVRIKRALEAFDKPVGEESQP